MPLSVTPTGSLSLPLAALATLLASSTTFQGLVGVGSAAAALDKISYPYWDLVNQTVPVPGAVISDFDGLHQSKDRGTFEEMGQLLLQLWCLPNTAPYGGTLSDPRDILLDFRNKLGAVLQDMLTNARNPVGDGTIYFGATKWEKYNTPSLIKSQDLDFQFTYAGEPVTEFVYAGFVIDWNS